jgi:Protein of unknown function (DUF1329)
MRVLARRLALPFALALGMLVLLMQPVRADVEPGDIIDKSNYQKIEGWVPDYVLDWVKAGDLTMKIGKLNFDATKEFWPQVVRDNWQANLGRYKINESNGIIDAKTGQPARGIKGLPFPEPDPADPTFPVMLMWFDTFQEYFLQGTMTEKLAWLMINRNGLEKSLILDQYYTQLDPTKSAEDYAQVTIFRQPFSMAGTGTLAIYPLNPLQDGVRYAYTPELRRVKRLSHRVAGSDTHFGLDSGPDDSWAGGPKTNIEEGTYRYLGERDALIPYFSPDSRKIDWNEKGELDIGFAKTGLKMTLGFEDDKWQGAPWHVMDLVWVKSKAYVVESRSKNPNYGYGPCEGWVEKGTCLHVYKRITDPSGKLWKGVYWPGQGIETPDGKFRLIRDYGWVEVDMRRDHGSTLCGPHREGLYRTIFAKDVDPVIFTRAGFIKFHQ